MTHPVSHAGTVLLVLALLLAGCTGDATGTRVGVGFILVGDRDDLGYNQAVWEGADALARALPDVDVLRVEAVPEDDTLAAAALERLIDDGASILFATSFGHAGAAEAVARAHPDVTVLHQGATATFTDLPNYGSYFGAHSEAAFGSGVVAASASQSGRLGFVGAFPIPATYNNINAFTLGAQSVRSDASTHVLLTGSWCDQQAQAGAVQALVAAGVDVLAQHQDCTTTILEEAAARGLGAVGYHSDGSEVAGDAWLVGAVWTWGRVYADIVETVLRGEFADSAYRTGFIGTVATGDNPFVLTEVGPTVTPATTTALEDVMEGFRGGVAVFRGPLTDVDGVERVPAGTDLDQAGIDAMSWYVPGVSVIEP